MKSLKTSILEGFNEEDLDRDHTDDEIMEAVENIADEENLDDEEKEKLEEKAKEKNKNKAKKKKKRKDKAKKAGNKASKSAKDFVGDIYKGDHLD